jgi:GPH family glycoside/pentoside/hexuronide:cation symporter
MALFAFLLFVPPPGGTATTVIYLFLMLELYYVFSTLSGGPYEALLPEIATTSDERVTVVGMRVYCGIAGAAVGLVGSSLITDAFGFTVMALVMASLAFAFRYLGAFGVMRHVKRAQDPAILPFKQALRVTFSNRYFLLFLPTFVLFQIGLQMLLGVVPYYVGAILEVEEEGRWVAALTAVAIGSMAVTVPAFAWLARRTSKRQAYSLAMLAATVTFPLLAFAGFVPGIPKEVQIVAAMVLLGAPVAGVYLFPATLTADIIDYDSLRTGLRREATYYGAQNFVEKTATSVAPLLLTSLLLLGRSSDDPLGIRLVGPAAGVILLFGYLVFRGYDLPDEVVPAAAAEGVTAPHTV